MWKSPTTPNSFLLVAAYQTRLRSDAASCHSFSQHGDQRQLILFSKKLRRGARPFGDWEATYRNETVIRWSRAVKRRRHGATSLKVAIPEHLTPFSWASQKSDHLYVIIRLYSRNYLRRYRRRYHPVSWMRNKQRRFFFSSGIRFVRRQVQQASATAGRNGVKLGPYLERKACNLSASDNAVSGSVSPSDGPISIMKRQGQQHSNLKRVRRA